MNVVIWNEYRHERENPQVRAIYPDGIHGALREGLARHGIAAGTATLNEPEHGLPADRLDRTDVLLWWGHGAHAEVADAVVDRVQRRVLDGMGLVILHSGHHAKICRRLLGTSCNLSWREAEGGERERIWAVNPGHAICAGANVALQKASGFTIAALQFQNVEWLVLAGCVLLGAISGFGPAVRAYRTEVATNLAPTT